MTDYSNDRKKKTKKKTVNKFWLKKKHIIWSCFDIFLFLHKKKH